MALIDDRKFQIAHRFPLEISRCRYVLSEDHAVRGAGKMVAWSLRGPRGRDAVVQIRANARAVIAGDDAIIAASPPLSI